MNVNVCHVYASTHGSQRGHQSLRFLIIRLRIYFFLSRAGIAYLDYRKMMADCQMHNSEPSTDGIVS